MFALVLLLLASTAGGGVGCASESPCVVDGRDAFLGARADAKGVIPLSISSRDANRWPADVKVRVTAGDNRWTLDLSKRELAKSQRLTLHAGSGEYHVVIEAPRHRRWQQRLRAEEPAKTVAARLEPLPSISGRVITRQGNDPIGGAAIEVDDEVIATADASGVFSFDADPEKWPASIRVHAGGYGAAIVAIPRSRVSASLLDIELAKGASVALTMDRSETIRGIEVELYKRRLDRRDPKPIKSMGLADDVSSVRFDELEPGDYVVTIKGPSPAARFGKKITVKSGEMTDVTASLRPMKLTIGAVFAGEPLSGAQVHLSNYDGLWKEDLTLDEDGRLELTTWQLGQMSALVMDEGTMTSPYFEKRSLEADDETEWVIRVSSRELAGAVLDSASGKPIPNANVALRTSGGTTTRAADASGRFRFTAVASGRHTLMAAAEGYGPAEVQYTYLETASQFEKNIELDPAGGRRVVVRDASGRPIGGAAVLHFAGLTLAGQRFTDETGRVTIPIREGEIHDLFVIPRDGSFGIATLRAASAGDRGDVTVTLQEARSTIVIRSETSDHEPIPDVWVVMRYNGTPIPFEVQQMLAQMQGATPVSGADGRIVLRQLPGGYYEFWPVGSAAEMHRLMIGLGSDAPVKLAARAGMNTATLTFAKPRPANP